MDKHLDMCLDAGINVEGTNGEVAPGQWEFQTFSKGAKSAGDQTWIARYLLERIAEDYDYLLTTIPNHLELLIGMVQVCMQIFQMTH